MESRLEKEIRIWEERERRFREDKIFSPEVLDGPLLKEKLAYFDRLSILYKPTSGSDQLDYRLLQAERQKIKRRLYPNLFRRLLAGVTSLVKLNQQAKKLNIQTTFSNDQLKSSLIRAGFSEHVEKAIANMKLGRDFSLPVSYYVSGKERMDFELNFKHGNQGEFKFESFKATLKPDSGSEKIEQTFLMGFSTGYNADQAFHLLSGRAVHSKESGGAWQQLDFNDKDADGNYRFKTFPDHYHKVDYFKALRELPHTPGNEINTNRLMDQLKNGEEVTVSLVRNGKEGEYKIQINPAYREIDIYNSYGHKVNLNAQHKPGNSVNEGRQVNNKKYREHSKGQKMN